MRSHPAFIPELDFVMEQGGAIIGQNVFAKAAINCDDGSTLPILTMGPICIANARKRQGYGKILLDYSLEKATARGFGAVCFEGNIAFYGKSGFTAASDFGIRYPGLPEGADSSFFLCKELKPGYLSGIRGTYAPPDLYAVDEAQAEAFDQSFPEKEKGTRPKHTFSPSKCRSGRLWPAQPTDDKARRSACVFPADLLS